MTAKLSEGIAVVEHASEDGQHVIVIETARLRLHLYDGCSKLELRGLPDGRGIIRCMHPAPRIFVELMGLCFLACESENELRHYIEAVRELAGGFLADQSLCDTLAARIRSLLTPDYPSVGACAFPSAPVEIP